MEPILKQVRRARRRLWMERFLLVWGRVLFVFLLLAAVAVAVPKLVVVESLPRDWNAWCIGGAVAGSCLAALAWTVWKRQSILDSAIEIDRRFQLRERVASCLALTESQAATPAGQALLRDAQRVVERLDVGDQFRIALGRRAWLPLIPAACVALIVVLVDNKPAQSSVKPSTAQLTKKEVDESTKSLRQRLAQQKKEAAKKGLSEAESLMRELEKKAEQLNDVKNLDRKQALVKLNDLADDLAQRREKLGGEEEVRRQFAGIKDLAKGPAEKMVEAMKQGNWSAASKELQKMQQQMAAGNMDDAAKQQLQRQLEQLKEKLQQAAEAREQAKQDLERQIAEKKKQGDLAEAGKLQQKLDQMQKQQAQSNPLETLAQQMSQCQQAMKQDDAQAAAQAMQQMAQQMEQMQQEMSEGELLEAAAEQFELTKSAMACDKCSGEGCSECQGSGNSFGNSKKFGKGGNGLGAGEGGRGPRPEEKNDVRFRESQVRQNPGRGAAVMVGEEHGPNTRGQVLESIKEELAAVASEAPDPLVIEQFPKSRREHAEDYFNQVLQGEP